MEEKITIAIILFLLGCFLAIYPFYLYFKYKKYTCIKGKYVGKRWSHSNRRGPNIIVNKNINKEMAFISVIGIVMCIWAIMSYPR